MVPPTSIQLTDAIVTATRTAVSRLFRQHPERFYYCSLITTGEAHAPYLSAWSEEALEAAAQSDPDPASAREMLKWSYADSPFCCFGQEHFGTVRALFEDRPAMDHRNPEQWEAEWQFRVRAMEAAVAQLDREGLFGRGHDRAKIVVNVDVMPPDVTNTERARRLNPPEAISDWLVEAAEQ